MLESRDASHRSPHLASFQSILAAMDIVASMDRRGLHNATICQGPPSLTPLYGEVRSVNSILMHKLE